MSWRGRPGPEDRVQAFQIETAPLRGRLVRMGPVLDQSLGRHAYPAPVARLLGEAVVLATALAATLKCDGVFTLQLKGDGPIKLMVADVLSGAGGPAGGREVRGYARFDAAAVAMADPVGGDEAPLRALLGSGWLAFTIDQGPDTERYQGIVGLTEDTLAGCVAHYFRQSEQLPTGLRLAVTRDGDGWRGAALLLQRLPDKGDGDWLEVWQQAMVLMATLTPAELLDPGLDDHELLYRLFHQDGVRVFDPDTVRAGCRCSRDRVAGVLRSLGRDEVEASLRDGMVEVTCEFCGTGYRFDGDQVAGLF
jgi:molecular chaperone Hsp33